MKPLIILILSCALLPSLLHAKPISLKCTVDEVSEHHWVQKIGDIWNYEIDEETNTVIHVFANSIEKYGPEEFTQEYDSGATITYLAPLWLLGEIRWQFKQNGVLLITDSNYPYLSPVDFYLDSSEVSPYYYTQHVTLNRSTLELKSLRWYTISKDTSPRVKRLTKNGEMTHAHASCEIVKIGKTKI